MAKTNVSLGATIGVVLLIFLFGIMISAMLINLAIKGEIATISFIIGLFFLGLLPILFGIFILISRIRGRDYDLNDLETNQNLPWFVKMMRLILTLLFAAILFGILLVLHGLETKSIWAITVIIILQDLLILGMLAYLFLSIGKLKYFREHKNRRSIQIAAFFIIMGLVIVIRLLLKR